MMSIIVSKSGSAARDLCTDFSRDGDCPLSPQGEGSDEVGALLDKYEQFLAGKARGTKKAYLRTVRHLTGWLAQLPDNEGQFQPLQLTQTAVKQYLTHLEQEGFSLYYRARVKSIISNFAEFLIKENKLFQGNPTRGIKLLPEQP
jgi:site-specific recombinase XerC